MKTVKPRKIAQMKKASDLKKEQEAKELVRLQREYKKAVLSRLYRGAELIEMRKHLQAKMNSEEYVIPMKWYGMNYPLHILSMEHDITQQTYAELLVEENYKKQALLNKGFTEEQIKKVEMTGEFFKEVPKEVANVTKA